ncbi:MAG: DUF4364 family protein [Clostridiales bacterium]|nr:DUF4364 family protein [Clostridiales bacterium]
MDTISTGNSDYAQVENKLLLLYLIDKMDIPLSTSQISQFALGESIMGYFELAECLSDMAGNNYIEGTTENNNTRYTITDAGLQTLDYFERRIPANVRNKINKYVLENQKYIKRDYETTANYFKDISSGDYTVKCGIYEDDNMLMEINLSVVTREHAKLICRNWKYNVNELYGEILNKLAAQNDEQCEANEDFENEAHSEHN